MIIFYHVVLWLCLGLAVAEFYPPVAKTAETDPLGALAASLVISAFLLGLPISLIAVSRYWLS
jgi:hypothetical protein